MKLTNDKTKIGAAPKITKPSPGIAKETVKEPPRELETPEPVISKRPHFFAKVTKRIVYIILRVFYKLFFALLYKLEIEGSENVPVSGPAILACSHASFLDPMVLFRSMPRKYHAIAGNWLFKIHAISWAIKAVDSIPANGSVNGAIATLKRGDMVAIYPTGICARTKEEMTMKPRKGVAVFAMRSGAPVVPIAINGTLEAWPQTRFFPKFFRKITVRIGKPIQLEKYYEEYIPHPLLEENLAKVMTEIGKLLD